MSKDRMHQQASRDMAQNHRGGNEGAVTRRTTEKGKEIKGAVTKRGSTSKA
jgi:hypothetical protein